MKRFVPTLLLGVVAFLGGYATSELTKVSAQAQPSAAQAQNPAAQAPRKPLRSVATGQATFFSSDDLKAIYQRPKEERYNVLLAGAPQYRLNISHHPYYDTPKMMAASKTMSHWDDGEMHEDNTQLYIIMEGTGAVTVGGTAVTERTTTPGEHGGAPIEGGTAYKVKPGDWVLIPPNTWHQVQPDPGGITYGLVHIHTRTNIP